MTTKIYNKLVRDKIPEIIVASGGSAIVRKLDDQEYFAALISKLDEEVAEFKADFSLEELADVQEVLLALADALAGRAELEKIRAEKAEKRGVFTGKIFLESV